MVDTKRRSRRLIVRDQSGRQTRQPALCLNADWYQYYQLQPTRTLGSRFGYANSYNDKALSRAC